VKIYAEATLVAPLLVAKTFARKVQEGKWDPDGRIFNKSHTAAEAEIEKQKVSGTPPQ